MAGIRGKRNPFPPKGESPSGIFSTRGKQKQDPKDGPHQGTMNYALDGKRKSGRTATNVSAGQTERHQAPVRQW